jgi:hypothetical protein
MKPPILPYQNFLSMGNNVKPVPYPAGLPDKGNRGFKPLKGKTLNEIIAAVSEAAQDEALAFILNDINDANGQLFSVGCDSVDISEKSGGCRVGGYVEFAINDKRLAIDTNAYFHIFFQFDAALSNTHFNQKTQFLWILQPAHFTDAGAYGYSSCVQVVTYEHPNKEAARDCWNKSLEALRACLKGVLYLKLNGAIITTFDRLY